MNVLMVGNGGREHALLWKLRKDAPETRFWVTRGNAGMKSIATNVDVSPTDVSGVTRAARELGIGLVVIGPEVPLVDGLADALAANGIAAFGPSALAAEIEGSKAFSKQIMTDAGVPTASWSAFHDEAAALRHLEAHPAPVVIKASGLAAGKGAIVAMTDVEARNAVRELLGGSLGDAGSTVIIESFMTGEELSLFAITDGRHCWLLPPAQDHKRIGEGDQGPNTGGMGAYSPVSLVNRALLSTVEDTILSPTLDAMRLAGRPFRGLLYCGLMLTPEGPMVVEYNCRFGDPETQVVLPVMNESLMEPLLAVARGGTLEDRILEPTGAAVTTVLASMGYPGPVRDGVPLTIPPHLPGDPVVFHAGTRQDGNRVLSKGGRVLAVTGCAADFRTAQRISAEGAGLIEFEGKQFRRDIGWREADRL